MEYPQARCYNNDTALSPECVFILRRLNLSVKNYVELNATADREGSSSSGRSLQRVNTARWRSYYRALLSIKHRQLRCGVLLARGWENMLVGAEARGVLVRVKNFWSA